MFFKQMAYFARHCLYGLAIGFIVASSYLLVQSEHVFANIFVVPVSFFSSVMCSTS